MYLYVERFGVGFLDVSRRIDFPVVFSCSRSFDSSRAVFSYPSPILVTYLASPAVGGRSTSDKVSVTNF